MDGLAPPTFLGDMSLGFSNFGVSDAPTSAAVGDQGTLSAATVDVVAGASGPKFANENVPAGFRSHFPIFRHH
jgi:hypothetical protein